MKPPQVGPITYLQSWLMARSTEDTTELYAALTRESLAITHELSFDHDQPPYPSIRAAQQRAAVQALRGLRQPGDKPSVTIDACRAPVH